MTHKAASHALIAMFLGLLIVGTAGAGATARAESSLAGPGYTFGRKHVGDHRHERRAHRRVLRILDRHGYRNIYSVRYHERRGLYVAKGYTRGGRHIRVFVDPHSGRIHRNRQHRRVDRALDRRDVVRRLVWAGYRIVSGPRRNDGVYVVRTEDRFGHRRLMHVDAYSGVIRHVRRAHRRNGRRRDD